MEKSNFGSAAAKKTIYCDKSEIWRIDFQLQAKVSQNVANFHSPEAIGRFWYLRGCHNILGSFKPCCGLVREEGVTPGNLGFKLKRP